PRIKLWPEAARLVFGADLPLPRLTPANGISADWDKRYLDLGERFVNTSLPLAGILVLEKRSDVVAGPTPKVLGPRDAWQALVRHSYVNYVSLDKAAFELTAWGSVLKQAWVRDLVLPPAGATLPVLAETIRETGNVKLNQGSSSRGQ